VEGWNDAFDAQHSNVPIFQSSNPLGLLKQEELDYYLLENK
jgi:hypothetical protein